MNRRDFVRLTTAGVPIAAIAEAAVSAQAARTPAAKAPSGAKAMMKVGTQHGHSDAILRACAAFGVNNICSGLPSEKMDAAWSVDGLSKLRDTVASHGITLDMVPLPMSSAEISRAELPAIYLDASPERDRSIDDICQMIRNCARASIFQVKYNFTLIGIPRSGTAPGRGRSRYSEFVYERAKQDPPLTIAGKVDADTYWERITYFLERVVPVAAEYKVKMGCHPQDPGVPKGTGWRGVDAVLGSPDGLKKFVSIKENPYHGLNFCQGTVSEQLEKPGEQIFCYIPESGRFMAAYMLLEAEAVHAPQIAAGAPAAAALREDANSDDAAAIAPPHDPDVAPQGLGQLLVQLRSFTQGTGEIQAAKERRLGGPGAGLENDVQV